LSLVVRVWVGTLRIRLVADELETPAPRVFAFWHGQQMALLAAPEAAGTAVMVSWSRDGALQTEVMRRAGLVVVRGSSSRGGARALSRIVHLLRGGTSAAFAVDGPRGPRGIAKPGAALAAAAAGAALVPLASASRRAIVVTTAWDRFEIPIPFSEVAVVAGPPLHGREAVDRPELIGSGIEEARRRAEALCGLRTATGGLA
jgi:lysophospholipid acyltransferase (LPLAT)-like uncharacterized protein